MSIKLQRALVPGSRFDRRGAVDMAHNDWHRDVVTEVVTRRGDGEVRAPRTKGWTQAPLPLSIAPARRLVP